MATLYTRTFNFKDALSDREVLEQLQFLMEKALPAIAQVPGVQSVKMYSGAGALRADLHLLITMEDAAVYERFLLDAEVRQYLGQLYGAWDLKTAGQSFRREVTPELIRALSSTG